MKVAFSRQRLAKRVNQLGRAISKDYAGRTLDVVIMIDSSFLFAADLIRVISGPVVCHFVRAQMRDVRLGGYERREIFFSDPPALHRRDVLVVDAVLNTGVTQDFLLKRLEEAQPRSLRLAVLFDKSAARRVNVKPAYTGFLGASKEWVGYGLPGRRGVYRNLPYVAATGARTAGRGRKRIHKAGRSLQSTTR